MALRLILRKREKDKPQWTTARRKRNVKRRRHHWKWKATSLKDSRCNCFLLSGSKWALFLCKAFINYSRPRQGQSASTWRIHRVELPWSRRAPGRFVPQVDVTCLSRSGKLIHMHGSSVQHENRITCTFTLRLTAENHKSHLSSNYSSGNTGICTQVKAAVTQDLMQSLLSQCQDSPWLQ